MSDKKWYYALNNQQQGPVDEAAIQQMVQTNTLNANTLVWQEGMAGWTALQNTPLQAIVQVRPAVPLAPPSVPYGYQPAMPAISAESLNQLFMWFWILMAASIPLSFIVIGMFTAIAAVVIFYILVYRYWQVIQDGTNRATPGKAVGFMFIPFFNFYWNFVAIRGLAEDMNRYCRERAIPAPVVSEQLALWYCILTICNIIPYLNFITGLAALVMGIILFSNFTKTAGAIINFRQAHA